MIAFIDDYRGVHGVEPICEVLPVAPSTYHAHAAWRVDPVRRSAQAQRDAALMPFIERVFDENFAVYGVRKVWRQLLREGHHVACCTVARLMKALGLQARHERRPLHRGGLVHHSDRGSQYVSIRYTERLAEAGIEPSVGSVGDSYDNALAETINGLYKAEVIHRRAPWKSFDAVEFATLEWVDWFNHRRLMEPIRNIPPAEAEDRYYAMLDQPALAA